MAAPYGAPPAAPAPAMMQAFPALRVRGLPFHADDVDVAEFFRGVEVVDVVLLRRNGRFSGEAIVLFANAMAVEYAMQRQGATMGRRYIELFRAKKIDYYRAVAAEFDAGVGGGNRDGPSYGGGHAEGRDAPRKRHLEDADRHELEHTGFLKMRGLPYSATPTDVVDFFDRPEMHGQGVERLQEDKVSLLTFAEGKPKGVAIVEFPSPEHSKAAMMLDKEKMGSRYVELFVATAEEGARALAMRS
eukprot:jgi/Pico_ML_1/51803/g2650.t1